MKSAMIDNEPLHYLREYRLGKTMRLSISIVTYRADQQQLAETLRTLVQAINFAGEHLDLNVSLSVVDNGDETLMPPLWHQLCESPPEFIDKVEWLTLSDNKGYGKANNEVILAADSDYHLLMNPDVELFEEALKEGLVCLEEDVNSVLVSPKGLDGSGRQVSLAKRFPSVLVLLLRGFASTRVKEHFKAYLESYSRKDLFDKQDPAFIDIASGCFMLCRTSALKSVSGFSPDFFLYFEDFDLSVRLKKKGKLVYLPSMVIVHHGGNVASKGWHHIKLFSRSACRFFMRHGWRWW